MKDTFEVTTKTTNQFNEVITILKDNFNVSIEKFNSTCFNVTCEQNETDDITDLLDRYEDLKYRMV